MRLRSIFPFIAFPVITTILLFYSAPVTVFTPFVFILGFLTAGFVEYFMHRFAFHNRKIPRKVKRLISNGHVYHHRNPHLTDNLVLPLSITLPLSLASLVAFCALFGISYSFWFYLGVMLSYFLYEFMHYAAHHLDTNLPYLKQMKKYHLEHHMKTPNNKFMITHPIFDWLFRT